MLTSDGDTDRLHRHFLGWDTPLLPRAAAVLCSEYAQRTSASGRTDARMESVLVVVPGARVGRRLKELLAEEAHRQPLHLVPPQIITPGKIPEMMVTTASRIASQSESAIAWSEALRSIAPDHFERLFARRPAVESIREWTTLGRELARLHELVASAGLRFSDVEGRCAELPGFRDVARWGVLREIQESYERRLRSGGLEDPQLTRLSALDDGKASFGGDIWLIGVSELPPLMRRFLEVARRPIHALIMAPPDRAEAFDAFGCVIPSWWAEAEVPVPEERLALRRRPSGQSAAIVDFLQRLDGRYSAEEIVIGVPDSEVLPHLEHDMDHAGVPTRPATELALRDSGPYRLLDAVASYADSRRFESLATLVRHPHLDPWLASRLPAPASEPTQLPPALPPTDSRLVPIDALDYVATRQIPATVPPAAQANTDPGAAPPSPLDQFDERTMVERIIRVLDEDLLNDLQGQRQLTSWMDPLRTFLKTSYEMNSLLGDDPGSTQTGRALETLGLAAAEIAVHPPELDPVCTASTACRILLDTVASSKIPAPRDEAAVELVGWLELHLDDAPVIILSGLNEGRLPESVRSDPFLPNRLRTVLGLEDDRRRYARDAYRLSALIASGRELYFVAGRQTETGDPLRPSRLLFAAPPETVARRLIHFYGKQGPESEEEENAFPDEADTTALREPPSKTTGSGFVLPPEPTIRLTQSIDTLRVTDFARVLTDPYGFVLQRYLKLEAEDDYAREMDPLRFGSLAHAVLERFADSVTVDSTDPDQIASTLDTLLRTEVGLGLARHPRVSVSIQIEMLRARLHAFAKWHADWIAQGWRVVGSEATPGREGARLDVDGLPVRISARVDRVDYHPDLRSWAIFDYKTSEKPLGPEKTHGPDKDGTWKDLQLPLYRWLLPDLTRRDGSLIVQGSEPTDVKLGYINLPGDLDAGGARFAEWSPLELDDAIEQARGVVRLLRSGDIHFDPNYRPDFSDPRMDALLGRGTLGSTGPDQDEAL